MDKRQIDRLLVKISYGDNDAFAELYDGTKRGVFSFLYSYLKNYENAEDAMQTVYLKIKQNIHGYRHGTDGRAWILQIAKNLSLNELNAGKRIVYTDDVPTGDGQERPIYGVADVMNETLSGDEIYIINLHVLWGYKHKEIAQMLGCPTGTVTSKYKRSIEKLKTALREGEK